MKKAFTLIELVFVIIIVSVLSVVALSKFYGDENNTSVLEKSVITSSVQLAIDANNLLKNSYMSVVDVDGKISSKDVKLTDLVSIHGENWQTSSDGMTMSYIDVDDEIIKLELTADRKATLTINCEKFRNITTQKKCKKLAPNRISTLTF